MTKKKIGKFDLVSIVLLAVLVVALVLTIVGICIGWVKSSSTFVGQTGSSSSTLSDWLGVEDSGIATNAAFAILTVIMTGLTAIAYAAGLFFKNRIVRLVTLVVAVLALACGVVTIITAYTFVNQFGSINGGAFLSASASVDAGPWLVFAFGVVGAIAGVVGAIKNK